MELLLHIIVSCVSTKALVLGNFNGWIKRWRLLAFSLLTALTGDNIG